jgi:hypothetical protein
VAGELEILEIDPYLREQRKNRRMSWAPPL